MKNRLLIIILLAIVSSGCQHATKNPPSATVSNTENKQTLNKLAIISINDVYRIAGINNGTTGGLARVRALRKQIEANYEHVLFLHAGDFLHPSFISKQDNGVAMIKALNMLDGAANQFDSHMLVTWGNHEFDKGRMRHVPIINDLLAQSEFTWLDSNISWVKENQQDVIQADHMRPYQMLQYGETKIGVFSFTTGMAHPEYVSEFADYQQTAEKFVPMLRELGADFVIGLTHHWLPDDLAMMALPEAHRPDIIFGGHEHYVQTEQVNGNWILKADADAASAIVAEISFSAQGAHVQPQVIQLDKDFPQDAELLALSQQIELRNDQKYCRDKGLEDDCLTKVLGFTQTRLMAEETEIRRFETNIGNTLADGVLHEFVSCGADIVMLNSGSIRLNQNIPAGSNITIKHLEEMFPYPSDLRLIEFNASLLPSILAHSISSWTANGHWLQIAGFAYIHNPEKQTAEHIHLKGQNESANQQKLKQQTIRAVVPYYLISDTTDHDGYVMLNEDMQVPCDASGKGVKDIFTELLKLTPEGLNSQRDYRICNTIRDSCLE
jgi:2',3'-cyclic-nucleotide 2'-phosphodiesterase (5'-nucleotidase family)